MKKKFHVKILNIFLILVFVLGVNITIFNLANFSISSGLAVEYRVKSDYVDSYKLYHSESDNLWPEESSQKKEYTSLDQFQKIDFSIPKQAANIKMDLGTRPGLIIIEGISLKYLWSRIDITEKLIATNSDCNDIKSIKNDDGIIYIESSGSNPYIKINLSSIDKQKFAEADKQMNRILKLLCCVGFNIVALIILMKKNPLKEIVIELFSSKRLIFNLAKNDFKTKYAGSYFGIIWAFIQPTVTILVYWFVFQVGFRATPVDASGMQVPFVLWLIAGIVPWFFFSEALMNATNSMIEYSYLVKKVVFKISILPVVKVFSSLFVHLVFVMITISIYTMMGFIPTIYMLQILYYTFCMFIFVLGLSYATCAISIFFRDLVQMINIFLQVGIWMTPIMWSYTRIPAGYHWIIKLNPMYYIIEGYRDSLIYKISILENINATIYFWVITIFLFIIGTMIFNKLKVHFADVL